jgi:uncharacterized membrane protein YccC
MAQVKRWFLSLRDRGWLVHSVRTAVGASVSMVAARLFTMPQPYWAAVTTIVVMQSTLGAAWDVSKRRLVGTALGAAAGGIISTLFQPSLIIYGMTLFALGIICATVGWDVSAYRFAGITLTIVTLISHAQDPAYVIAMHRFAEVSIGILVALALTALWPAKDVSK